MRDKYYINDIVEIKSTGTSFTGERGRIIRTGIQLGYQVVKVEFKNGKTEVFAVDEIKRISTKKFH